MAPSALKYIMRAPLTQTDLHSEHPGLADVIANISSKTAAVQDEYLRGADMTFTTGSTLADLLELHRSGSAFFTAEQNTCLSENIARVKRAAGCEDGDAQLQAPVSPYKDLAAAAAVEITHGNLKQYAVGVAETLCWTHSLAALNSMREGYAPPPIASFCPLPHHSPPLPPPPAGSSFACRPPSCATCSQTTRSPPCSCRTSTCVNGGGARCSTLQGGGRSRSLGGFGVT